MDRILEVLIEQFLYDVDMMSYPWMYYWGLVPITAYLAFFFVKWVVLTAPLWLPLVILFRIMFCTSLSVNRDIEELNRMVKDFTRKD